MEKAAENSHIDTVLALNGTIDNALLISTRNGNLKTVEYLIEKRGANVNFTKR